MKLKVMTFNMQHGLNYLKYKSLPKDEKYDCIDIDLMADAIRKCDPDIVGLNEVRGRGEDPLYFDEAEQIAAKLGYHCYFGHAIRFPGHGPYGNAILSKFPIIRAERILIPDPPVKDEDAYYETRCLIKAEFDVAGGLTVYGCHFGLAKAEARNAVATLCHELETQEKPCVFMGDLNLLPESEILAPVYERLQDTAAYFTEPQLSFPSDAPDRKIDYVFVSRDVKVLEAEIPAIVAADHRPHTALIEIGE
ncbi:MAG: endonuclease/exonuclease/phosphatase family protein [Clostridia bacterium]|nr:endonuclease/exonuclease/phosphatase family protein [Clostridia bacterium]